MQELYQMFAAITKDVRCYEPMKNHTSFRTGGPADYFVLPKSAGEVQALLSLCKQESVPIFVMGNGSNLLVSDKGIRGLVIKLGKGIGAIKRDGTHIVAEAGALLSSLAAFARDEALAGLAFAGGIPGSVGGAVKMNAGAYGGEMCQVVTRTQYVDDDGSIKYLEGEEHDFSYRHSYFSNHSGIVLQVEFSLLEGSREEIKAEMEELGRRRREKQPIELPSAGSTFKRPKGYYAAALIEQAGLKGYAVGGAQVSPKHAGFVVNNGGATTEQILTLMEQVQDRVYEHAGVYLEPEVRIVGEF